MAQSNYKLEEHLNDWVKWGGSSFNVDIINNQPDYKLMETFISAIQKQVIKDVVLYTDKKLNIAK
jgi:hypothetical protein